MARERPHERLATMLHVTPMLQPTASTSCIKIDCLDIPLTTPMPIPIHITLPVYTPSAPSPIYSCEPACNEQRLQHTPRFNQPIPTGTFKKKSGKVTITLLEQEDGAQTPTYGRHALISGAVLIEKAEMVARVSLKVS